MHGIDVLLAAVRIANELFVFCDCRICLLSAILLHETLQVLPIPLSIVEEVKPTVLKC